MDATPTKGTGSGGSSSSSSSGSNEHTPRTPVVTLPVYQPLPSLSSEAGDDDVSWAGNGTAAAIVNDLDRLPSTDSSHQAAAGRAVLLQDEEEGPGPEEDGAEDGSGSRGRLTVSISALSLSSAAEHQQKHGEGPATPQSESFLRPHMGSVGR